MAIAHVGTQATSGTSGDTTCPVDLPSFSLNDVMVIVIAITDATGSVPSIPTPPTGWTEIAEVDISAVSGVGLHVFYKIMDADDVGASGIPVVFTADAGVGFKASATAYSGVSIEAPIDDSDTNTGTGTTATCPDVTASEDNAWVLRIAAGDGNPTLTNASVTIRNNTGGIAVPGNGCNTAIGDESVSAGAAGTSAYTVGASEEWGAVSVVLAERVTYSLSGTTKDKDGSTLGTCEVFLLRDLGSNVFEFVDYTQSNGSGAYSFTGLFYGGGVYQVVAWKDDSPHVMDVTDYVVVAS